MLKKMNRKMLQSPNIYAIFLKSWGFKDIKYQQQQIQQQWIQGQGIQRQQFPIQIS